jgi:hypothetical protein
MGMARCCRRCMGDLVVRREGEYVLCVSVDHLTWRRDGLRGRLALRRVDVLANDSEGETDIESRHLLTKVETLPYFGLVFGHLLPVCAMVSSRYTQAGLLACL